MAQKRSLPRICIALGLPDVPTLLEHARREAEAGETFLEFLVAIRRQNERMLGVMRDRGWLRTDIAFDELVDTWIVLSSVETYVRLRASGRSDDDYAAWLERMAARTFLGYGKPESLRRARTRHAIPGEGKLTDGRPFWTPQALRNWHAGRKIAGSRHPSGGGPD